MKRRIALTVFVLVAALQLAVPAHLIVRYENVLRHGVQHRFRARPIDPYDAFRGRYVMLSVAGATTTTLTENQTLERGDWVYATVERGDWVYATVERGADGFSRFASVATERPSGEDYVRTRVEYVSNGRWVPATRADGATTASLPGHYVESKLPIVTLDVPFDRYFMEEGAAPRAEKVYRAHSRHAVADSEVWVRVLAGDAVVENLVVAGQPIGEYLRDNPEQKDSTKPVGAAFRGQ